MPRLTFNVELSSKPDKKGRSSVMIRLHLKGQLPKRILTSVRIEKAHKYWNTKLTFGKWVVGHPEKERLNTKIRKEYDRVQDQVEKWQDAEPNTILTPAILAERLSIPFTERYFDLVAIVLEDVKEQAYATFISKRSAVNAFKLWTSRDLLLQSVSAHLCRQFQDHLKKTPMENGEKRKAATINKLFARLHVIHKQVLIKGGMSPKMAELGSPWKEVEKMVEAKPRKVRLTESEIEEVAAINVASTRRKVTPEAAFRIWMLARLLAGARYSDMMTLRYRSFTLNEQCEPVHLRYEMLKTGNWISIPVFQEGWELLKLWWNPRAKPTDYVLPFLCNNRPYNKILTHEQYRDASFEVKHRLYNDLTHWNRQINLCLKEMEEATGLTEKLRTHNARHSFAELARKIMQDDKSITVYDIQLMLGHSSIATTEAYYNDSSNQDSTRAMQAIFERHRE